jgi:hypothetical protein
MEAGSSKVSVSDAICGLRVRRLLRSGRITVKLVKVTGEEDAVGKWTVSKG